MTRSKIIRRMKALMSITQDNGATESEAIAAAQKLSDLQAKYNLTLSEQELREEDYTEGYIETQKPNATPLEYLLGPITKLTDTEGCIDYYKHKGRWCRRLVFFGSKGDIEIAVYIYGLMQGTLARGCDEFKTSRDYQRLKRYDHPRRVMSDFRKGMCLRLAQRIYAMAELRKSNQHNAAATGTDLVVLKGHLVAQAFQKKYPNLGKGKKLDFTHSIASIHGANAAEQVAIRDALKEEGNVRQAITASQ